MYGLYSWLYRFANFHTVKYNINVIIIWKPVSSDHRLGHRMHCALLTCPSMSATASAPPSENDWQAYQPIRCVVLKEAEVNRERERVFLSKADSGDARERERLARDQGHGLSISMETLHWLTEVSGGEGAFGGVTYVTDSQLYSLSVKSAETNRRTLLKVARNCSFESDL